MKYFKILTAILIALILVSCASQRVVSTTEENQYRYAQRLDSIFRATLNRDSIYVRDSIYIMQKGDTVNRYVEKIRYRYKIQADTAYLHLIVRDTIYIEKRDSIAYEKPILVDKPVKWYNKGFQWIGKLCLIAVILWILFLYLKRKF